MNEYQEKLRTLGVSLRRGGTKRKPVVNEDTGQVGGYEVEHWDDHQDAHVIAPTFHSRSKVMEED